MVVVWLVKSAVRLSLGKENLLLYCTTSVPERDTISVISCGKDLLWTRKCIDLQQWALHLSKQCKSSPGILHSDAVKLCHRVSLTQVFISVCKSNPTTAELFSKESWGRLGECIWIILPIHGSSFNVHLFFKSWWWLCFLVIREPKKGIFHAEYYWYSVSSGSKSCLFWIHISKGCTHHKNCEEI